MFAFAGVWQRWRGPINKGSPAVDIETYSFLTTLPIALTASNNHERSPMLSTSEADFDAWLYGAAAAATALLRPHPADRIRIVQDGFEKKDLLASEAGG